MFDTKQSSHKRYGVSGIPHMVVIDKKGLVRKVQVGSGEEGERQVRELVSRLVEEN